MLLTEVRHDMSQLRSADVAVSVLIEDLEGLFDLLLAIGVAHLARHHRQEFGEIDGAIAVRIDLVDHVLEFSFGGVLPERPHDGAELFCSNGAIAVCEQEGCDVSEREVWNKRSRTLVKQGERLLELFYHRRESTPCSTRLISAFELDIPEICSAFHRVSSDGGYD